MSQKSTKLKTAAWLTQATLKTTATTTATTTAMTTATTAREAEAEAGTEVPALAELAIAEESHQVMR